VYSLIWAGWVYPCSSSRTSFSLPLLLHTESYPFGGGGNRTLIAQLTYTLGGSGFAGANGSMMIEVVVCPLPLVYLTLTCHRFNHGTPHPALALLSHNSIPNRTRDRRRPSKRSDRYDSCRVCFVFCAHWLVSLVPNPNPKILILSAV
jgi:hypothetical protein